MLAESNSWSLSYSTQQLVSLVSLSQETQDKSSLLGEVGDLLGTVHSNSGAVTSMSRDGKENPGISVGWQDGSSVLRGGR